ncbi:MAG: zinc ABC transporter substrate-binding protein, partial [Desulfurococcales archaeon]|nr:zinc ABC transporter substrate-binding protein [Desulfurococcales archaeon]
RMLKIASLIILITIIAGTGYYYTAENSKMTTGKENGILIISTFPTLVDDINLVTCRNETVKTIVPKGVDPHDYQLTPEDAELLKKADVIVSTGHAPFETKIRYLVKNNETHAILIEIPKIPGIHILDNPVTGNPNYHMPIMDPRNYMVFMEDLVSKLDQADPGCRVFHHQKLMKLNSTITRLLSYTGKFNLTVVASDPTVEYEVSWLGLKVEYLFIVEHGTPASFQELNRISEALKKGEVRCIVASTSSSEQLQNLLKSVEAGNSNVKVVYIPGPLSEGSIPYKLNQTIASLQDCLG